MEHDAALGGAVQLGQHHAGDVDDLGEHPGLHQSVLSDGRVEHQQHLVDRRLLLHDALDLAQLVHQAGLGVQPAGGVDHDHVDAALDAPVDRVECDGGGIGLFLAAHDLGTDPLTPRLQLVGGSRAERVRRAEHDTTPVGDQDACQLAGRGGLAGAVDADDEDDGGTARVWQRPDRPVERRVELLDQDPLEQRPGLTRGADRVGRELGAQRLDDGGRRGRTEIGHHQRVLDLLPAVLVEIAGAQQAQHTLADRAL